MFLIGCATIDKTNVPSSDECNNSVPAISPMDEWARNKNKQYIHGLLEYMDKIKNNEINLAKTIKELKTEKSKQRIKVIKAQKKRLLGRDEKLRSEFEKELEDFSKKSQETQENIIRQMWNMAKADTVAECDRFWSLLLDRHLVQKAWEFSPDYLFDYTVHRWRLENWSTITDLAEWKDDCFVFASNNEFGRLYRSANGNKSIVESLMNKHNQPKGKVIANPKKVIIPKWGKCQKWLREGKKELKPVYRWKSPVNGKECILPMVTIGNERIAVLSRETAEDARMTIGNEVNSGIDFVCYSSFGIDGDGKKITSITPEFFFKTVLDQWIALTHNYYIVADWYGVKKFIAEVYIKNDKQIEAKLNPKTPHVGVELDVKWESSSNGSYVYKVTNKSNTRKKGVPPKIPSGDPKLQRVADTLARSPTLDKKIEQYQCKDINDINLKLRVSGLLGLFSVENQLSFNSLKESRLEIHMNFKNP